MAYSPGFTLTGSVSLENVFGAAQGLAGKTIHVFGADLDALTITCLLLFMGAMGKSAQFLLHTWLPDAMEGPTPVSALIHAATMVTAGVFMVARLSPLFDLAPVALSVVTVVGATTAFFAATVGLVQNDIKRVIAYSTCSQLGYMFVGLGVGGYSLGIFHLFTHAFFKALLFLGAGSVITAMHHEQDMRVMGGLRKEIPVTFWMMMIGTLSLTGVGIPLTSLGFAGFVSKDAIIESGLCLASVRARSMLFLCVVVAAGFTSFYSWRLMFMTFFGERRSLSDAHGADAHDGHAAADDHGHDDHAHDDHGHGEHIPHESPPVMLIPLAVLALGAVIAGLAFRHVFIGGGFEGFWKGALFLGADNKILEEMETAPWLVSLLPTLMMLGGAGIAYYMYIVQPDAPRRQPRRAEPDPLPLPAQQIGISTSSTISCSCGPPSGSGDCSGRAATASLIDGLGPDGISARVIDVTRNVVKLQSGYICHHAFAMLLGGHLHHLVSARGH